MPPTSRLPSLLSPYVAVAVRSYRRHATYRGATLAGVVTNTLFGFVYAYVFLAVHARAGDVGSFTATQTVTYVFFAQAFLMMTGAFGDREISDRIRTGDIAADLYRPVDFQAWWLAHDLGKAAFYALFRGVPPLIIGMAVLRFPLPTDPIRWVWFLVAVLLAATLAFTVRFLANLSGFWLLDARGVVALAAISQIFFAGHVVPLQFMPAGLETLARTLPFSGITALPVELLLGVQTNPPAVFGFQAGWIAVLLLAGRAMLATAQRKLVVQGG